ncbi:MAG: DsbE family thiol:disulfide interchange protein [Gammaproteobacteria bacterium]|nr:DsbE family thiol:disulfide interchange protein [Gammaproteobacteria bacterium]
MKLKYLLPLGIFLLLVLLLGVGLTLDPREVPSPLIGKAAPEFSLPQLHQRDQQLSPKDLLGEVWLLNVWASWCVSCRAEHELVRELAATSTAAIIGLNYKDEVADAQRWLLRYGDPYRLSVSDIKGNTGIDWGVYGVPETFIMDKRGIIRHKQIGPITRESLEEKILPLLAQLEEEQP